MPDSHKCSQATNADRVLGLGCLLLSVVVFVYYTIWVIISVSGHAAHSCTLVDDQACALIPSLRR